MSEPTSKEATSRIYDVLIKRKIFQELEKLVTQQFLSENPNSDLHPGEVWYHVGEEANLLIGDRSFPLARVTYMNLGH